MEPVMPERRLEDRIRSLCHEALVASDDRLYVVTQELRTALQDQIRRVRAIAQARLLAGLPIHERRVRSRRKRPIRIVSSA